MGKTELPRKLEKAVNDFIIKLENIYNDELISVVLYGSVSSGEYSPRHSNVNLAVVLKDASLRRLSKISSLLLKSRMLNPVFLTENYITSSTDVFPIEFLDMKENYTLLYGKDFLKTMNIDTKNLRFQCEQELKSRVINLKREYLKNSGREELQRLIFSSLTSVMHILRNLIRLKGHKPAYEKEGILAQASKEFGVNTDSLARIWKAKREGSRLCYAELEELFFAFSDDLEKIAELVDRL